MRELDAFLWELGLDGIGGEGWNILRDRKGCCDRGDRFETQIGYWKLENGAALIFPVCQTNIFTFLFSSAALHEFSPPRLKRIWGTGLVPRGHYIAAKKQQRKKRENGDVAICETRFSLC